MARRRKITSEELICLIDQYAFEHPRVKITIPKLSNFISDKGYEVAAYLIRRDAKARECINKKNEKDYEEMQRYVVTYHQLDVEEFLKSNGTREKLKTSLTLRESYYASIASLAAQSFEENMELKNSNENYQKTNAELKSKLEKNEKIMESKVIKEYEAVIWKMKKLMNDYVYPEVANQLLINEGLLDSVNEIINKEKLEDITITPESDMSETKRRYTEDLMKEFFQ